MRIIAGRARGRRLAAPPGRGTRPSTDRMREALFSSIAASEGELSGVRFLDLYAGSAAVGLEAWSRGAAHVLAVESDARAARTARQNVAAAGASREVVVRAAPVERVVAGDPPTAPYGIAFADPPYDLAVDKLGRVLAAAVVGGWLESGALVVVERASRDPAFSWPAVIAPLRSRSYGEGTLWYGRVGPVAEEVIRTEIPVEERAQ